MTKDLKDRVNPALRAYVEAEILPRYDAFDKGHQHDHALTVIRQALELAEQCKY